MIGLDNRTGPHRALIARDVERLIRAMDARPRVGTRRAGAQGIAAAFGLTVRSVYRYWPGRVQWLEIAGYRFAFLVRPGERPRELDQGRRS